MHEKWMFFTRDEFKCKCGNCENRIENRFIDLLDEMRLYAGVPFVVHSGYRCPDYNAEVSNTGRDGPHTTGLAADIRARSSQERHAVMQAAIKFGIERIGVGGTFLHVDISPDHPQKVIWLYG